MNMFSGMKGRALPVEERRADDNDRAIELARNQHSPTERKKLDEWMYNTVCAEVAGRLRTEPATLAEYDLRGAERRSPKSIAARSLVEERLRAAERIGDWDNPQ